MHARPVRAVRGPAAGGLHHLSKPDKDNVVYVNVVDSYGTVAMEIYQSQLSPFDKAAVTAWARTQIDIIR